MTMMMMMIKDRRDIRPLLVKFGVALALSFAGFLYSRIRTKRIKPRLPPPPSISDCDKEVDYGGRFRIRDDPHPEIDSLPIDTYDKPRIRVRVDSADRDGFLLPEFDELVKEFGPTSGDRLATSPKEDTSTFKINKEPPKVLKSIERDDYEQEIESLKAMIRNLRERERHLEVKLLEYYGLKEQETAMLEIQNRLKINSIEAKLFSMRIESLQADNKRLEAQVADYSKVVSELEAAKAKIKLLKRKIRYEAEQSKEQILELTQRVAKLRDQELEGSDSDVLLEVQRVNDLKAEAEELRKSNERLQQENADLARRLDSTQILANSVLEDPEKDELDKEMLHLREENTNLSQQVERLQTDRCADAEELVYLRWINACLRYELRNYQPPPGKTVARDLSKSLSPTSEAKAKQLILEYANTEEGDHKGPSIVDFDFDHWPSSQPSYLTDTTEHDHEDSPGSSSSHKHHSKKIKFFAKLRRLIRGKHGYHHHNHHHNHDNHHHNHDNHQDHHQSGRTSPITRSFSVDDLGRRYSLDSPRHNSSSEAGTDDHKSETRSPRFASSSQNSNNSSIEHHPLSSLAEEDAKDIENARMSDSGSSQGGGVRFVLGRGSANSSPLDHRHEHEGEEGHKSELAKYAEVLRESQWLQRMHKKSASFSAG